MTANSKTPVMVLQELTTKNQLPPPDYQIVYSISGTHENRFDFVVSVAGVEAKGSGSSKQIGKHEAAFNALQKLKEIGFYNPSETPVSEFKVPLRDEKSPFKSALNCIGDLTNVCVENKIPAPEFYEISSVGPPHAKEFTFECRISSIKTEAKAYTKKMAKHLAAKEMLERIKDIIPDLILEENESMQRLTDKDKEAITKYSDFREVVIPDKSVKIDEFPYTLKKIMNFKNLTYDDFAAQLKIETEESLKQILEKLELAYDWIPFQEDPPMVAFHLRIDTPLVTIGCGKTAEEAKQSALQKAFKIINSFMEVDLP